MSETGNMPGLLATTLMTCALLLLHRPVAAQSGSAFELARGSVASVSYYVAAEAVPGQLALPSNLVVSSMHQPLVESMLRDSPTFRRQCVRIAGETALTVHLSIGLRSRSYLRATTRVSRDAIGRLVAFVEIGSLREAEELVAHEFEHIIEQLDGVDLAARAGLAHSGVTALGPGRAIFETQRATRMGLKVAAELGR
jgi:hypothetical protein